MILLIIFHTCEVSMIELSQEVLKLHLDSDAGIFSILPEDNGFPAIKNASFDLSYHKGGELLHHLNDGWAGAEADEYALNGEQGTMKATAFHVPSNPDGLVCELTFAVAEEYPLTLWKIKVTNQGPIPVIIENIDLLNAGKGRSSITFDKAVVPSDFGFFHNGWQSWSPAGWVSGDGKMPVSHMGIFQEPMIYNDGTPKAGKRGLHTSDFFAAIGDRKNRKGFVIGFLSQKQHFGSIQADFRNGLKLRVWANGDHTRLDPGASMETDWAVYTPILLDHREPMEKYFEAVARENHIRVPQESPVGWCSWYYFYTKISTDCIRDNLKTIVDQQENLPIQLVQIDDGFETQVGDWFSFTRDFPEGVKPLAQEIKEEGLLPGLWLAPFIAHPDSKLIKDHPEWILRTANGKPVNAGLGWGNKLFTGLDLTVPEALNYACRVDSTASKEWGYPYLKLDFLYAAALPGVYHDPTKTRAQVLRKGMEAVREAVGPDVTLLGCGAPFGPMLGLVEAMRIGPDVSGDWKAKFAGIGAIFKNEPSMPCAFNSIRDILTRANLHKHWWINDPDCLLIRDDSHLNLAEVQTLTTAIAVTGGSLLLSDDLPKLSKERLRMAEVLLPVIGERARVIDWFDAEIPARLRLDQLNDTGEWQLLAKFNWTDKSADLIIDPEEYDLPAADYWVTDFWRGKVQRVLKGDTFKASAIPAHGCVLAAFRRLHKDQPLYLGSDLHFSMGCEVAEWQATASKVTFTLRLPRRADGKAWVYIPWQKFTVEVDGKTVEKPNRKGSLLELPVKMDGFTRISISKR
jgi:alpha-galactosidase